MLEFIHYTEDLAPHFRDLNLAWVKKYFEVEPIDEELLNHPKENIIDKGGHIFFFKLHGEIVGTFALLNHGDGVLELSKMAVREDHQGNKLGNRMLEFSLYKAKELNAKKVILYSNTKLGPAIHLYRKYGFKEVPMDKTEYKRSNIKMEFDINH